MEHKVKVAMNILVNRVKVAALADPPFGINYICLLIYDIHLLYSVIFRDAFSRSSTCCCAVGFSNCGTMCISFA